MNRKRVAAIAGGAVGLVLVTGAIVVATNGDDGTADTTTTTEATTTTAPETTTTSSTTTTSTTTTSTTTTTTLPTIHRQPLTGEPVERRRDIEERPALAVKIDNAPAARSNHSGLAVADIVFEEIVEAEITRFAAVFHTEGSDPVGPIRSGRSQDVDLLTSFNRPLFAWSGGNPGVTQLIADSTLTDLNATRVPGYYRGSGVAPHNLYSSTDVLWGLTPPDHPGRPDQQYEYLRPEESFRGRPATGIDLDMRSIDVQWTWNAELGQYERAQEGGPHIDAVNGQIAATNVVVVVAEYLPSAIDSRSPEAQTVGNGPLYVFSDGQVIEGRWRRESGEEPLQFVRRGEPIALSPGNTWIELAEAVPTLDPANPDVAMEITAG
jgi:hypothetical protein